MIRAGTYSPILLGNLVLLLNLGPVACQDNIDSVAEFNAKASSAPSKGKKNPPAAGIAWEVELYFRTYSSPRLFVGSDSARILIAFGDEAPRAGGAFAVDVATGERRWSIATTDELFALPTPLTPRANGQQPWIFSGRDGQLRVVDGDTGDELWHFRPFGDEGRLAGIYNFYSGREFGDVNGDGVVDYLVTNGGDSRRAPGESRPAGHLMVLSGMDGSIIHQLRVPSGHETYCSPLIWPLMDKEWVVFGTGGETSAGSLWGVPADSVRKGTLSGIRSLISSKEQKGFIAPPSFADLDSDGLLDLIATPFDGRLIVISGSSMKALWTFASSDEEETQASPAVGDFDGDGDLDIVAVVHKGVFPHWQGAAVRAFDGATGTQLWEYSVHGDLMPPSPLAADMDADGCDEIFFVESEPGYFMGQASRSRLQVVHVEEDRIETLAEIDGLSASSGWIGDADGDGWLEWFVPLSKIGRGGLMRYDLGRPVPDKIAWGGYLGTKHDGKY